MIIGLAAPQRPDFGKCRPRAVQPGGDLGMARRTEPLRRAGDADRADDRGVRLPRAAEGDCQGDGARFALLDRDGVTAAARGC
jgi:hypothetical protein